MTPSDHLHADRGCGTDRTAQQQKSIMLRRGGPSAPVEDYRQLGHGNLSTISDETALDSI